MIGYGFMFAASFVLLVLCIINLLKHYAIPKDPHQNLGLIRHLLVICVILQICVYLGYFFDIHLLYQISWCIWIPTSLFCITHFGIKVAYSFLSINKLKLENSFEITTKILGYLFWITASMVDVIGTTIGYVLNDFKILQICWASWKILACIAILFVISLLGKARFKVKTCIRDRIIMTKYNTNEINMDRMKKYIKEISQIILCLLFIIGFLIGSIIQNFRRLYKLTHNNDAGLDTSILTVLLDAGMWIFVHMFILIYTWITNNNSIQKIKSKSDTGIECSTRTHNTTRNYISFHQITFE